MDNRQRLKRWENILFYTAFLVLPVGFIPGVTKHPAVATAVILVVAVLAAGSQIPYRRSLELLAAEQATEQRWQREHQTREHVLEAAEAHEGSINWFVWLDVVLQKNMDPTEPVLLSHFAVMAERIRSAQRLHRPELIGDLAILAPVFFFAKGWLEPRETDGFLLVRLSDEFFEEVVYPYWRTKEAEQQENHPPPSLTVRALMA